MPADEKSFATILTEGIQKINSLATPLQRHTKTGILWHTGDRMSFSTCLYGIQKTESNWGFTPV